MTVKILQFGEGDFARGFLGWMLQKVAAASGRDYHVTLVQDAPKGTAREIAAAGSYHVLLRGYENGKYAERLDRVDVIKRGVNPFEERDVFYAIAEDPAYAVVASDTAGAGIFYERGHAEPHNYPSFLAEFLRRRMWCGLQPPLMLPLERIDRNGDRLRETIRRYASEWGWGEKFFTWLDGAVFYNTLADRLVTGYPEDAAGRIEEQLGRGDPYLSSGEHFHLLVAEGPPEISRVIPFDAAGLNVVVTPGQIGAYRDRKVRVLGGLRTASVPVALQVGIEEVDKFARHEWHSLWMRELAHKEIVHAIGGAPEALDYADSVAERFRNPALGHKFRSIAANSIAKCNARLRPTLEGYFEKEGALPPIMTDAVLSMVRLYSEGPTNTSLPGGPLALSDYAGLKGGAPEDILDAMFPGLDGGIMRALRRALRR